MITLERLKQVYFYRQETGEFLRLEQTWSLGGKAQVGKVGGCDSGHGYRVYVIDRRKYYGHRLAWIYMTGSWPPGNIDHIDGNPSNNRWSNLRLCDQSQNCANQKRRRDNSSGFKGVSRTASGTWQAVIWVKQKKICLGTFATPEEAFSAYCKAAETHFGSFHRKI